MTKWIIGWSVGFEEYYEVVEAHNFIAAQSIAYVGWLEEAKEQGNWIAEPYAKELAVELGLEVTE